MIVVCKDQSLKSNKESYVLASGTNSMTDCIFIGDNLIKVYEAPTELGMESYLITAKNRTEIIRK